MKTYGTREDVYNGFAKKTRGGLTKNDIILKGGKFISRRISERMRNVQSNPLGVRGLMNKRKGQNNRNITRNSRNSKSCKNNYHAGSMTSTRRRNKKSRKNVRFVLSNNRINPYYCPELNGGVQQKTSNHFQITQMPEIDVNSLFYG